MSNYRFFQPKSERRKDDINHINNIDDHHATNNSNENDDDKVNSDSVQSDSGQCWRFVKQCSWVKYNTVCKNKPVVTCQVIVQNK